ncbi:MAG: nuclear transport factor 2 family protein [Gaiellaceae bacterium]
MRINSAGRLLVAGAVVLVLVAGAAPPPAQSGSASTAQRTLTEVSRSIAKRYLAATIAKSTSRAVWSSLYGPDVVVVDGPSGETLKGIDSSLRVWREWLRTNPRLRITGSVWCAGSNWAVVTVIERTPSMLHRDATTLKIRKGLIVREIDYYETTSK